jgi:hypothetical protein
MSGFRAVTATFVPDFAIAAKSIAAKSDWILSNLCMIRQLWQRFS